MPHDLPIKNKALHRSASALLYKMKDSMSKWQRGDLQYESQEEETKRHLYAAIDAMRKFVDNIS